MRKHEKPAGDEEKELKNKREPVSENAEFLTYTESVRKEFEFLVADFDFRLVQDEWVSREHCTTFLKSPIIVHIIFELGTLPGVMIMLDSNTVHSPSPLDNVDTFNPKLLELSHIRSQRRDPEQKRFLNRFMKKNQYDHTELDEDFEQYGKAELVEYLKEAALTVRENLEFKKGVLKNLPY